GSALAHHAVAVAVLVPGVLGVAAPLVRAVAGGVGLGAGAVARVGAALLHAGLAGLALVALARPDAQPLLLGLPLLGTHDLDVAVVRLVQHRLAVAVAHQVAVDVHALGVPHVVEPAPVAVLRVLVPYEIGGLAERQERGGPVGGRLEPALA